MSVTLGVDLETQRTSFLLVQQQLPGDTAAEGCASAHPELDFAENEEAKALGQVPLLLWAECGTPPTLHTQSLQCLNTCSSGREAILEGPGTFWRWKLIGGGS